MSAPDGLEPDVTLTCEECGAGITGRPRGKGSASWKLGLHLSNVHKIPGKKSRARKGDVPDADLSGETGASPVIAAVRQAAADIGARSGAPNADELAAGLGRGLSLTTIFASSWMVDTDPRLGNDEESLQYRGQLIKALSVTPKAGSDVMRPIGRAFAGTKLNARYGRAIVDNVDVLASVAELGLLAMHWRQYLLERRAFGYAAAELDHGEPARLAAVPMPAPAPAPGSEFRQDWPNNVPNGHTAPGSQGRLATPEDVQRLIRERNGG